MKKNLFIVVVLALSAMTMNVSAQGFFKRVGRNIGKMVEYTLEDHIYSAVDGLLNGSSYRYGFGPIVASGNSYRSYRYGSRLASGYSIRQSRGFYEIYDSRGRLVKEEASVEPDLSRLFSEYGVTRYKIAKFDYLPRYKSTYYELITDQGTFHVSTRGNIYQISR